MRVRLPLPILAFMAWLLMLIPLQDARAAGFAADPRAGEAEPRLVLVRITTEAQGTGTSILVDGKALQNYQPRIIQVFPATGVVMDDQNHILAYLGYRWLEMQRQSPKIEILTIEGTRQEGRLVGIDQNLGVAVVHARGARLEKTAVCLRCEMKDGRVVITPLFRESNTAQFQSIRVLSVGHGEGVGQGVWTLRVNRPLVGAGETLLDAQNRVLGFVAGQGALRGDPSVVNTIVYPMSQVMASAEKILKAGGDIQTGWLGIFIDESTRADGRGIPVDRVEEGGPAYKAGLRAGDIVVRYGGREVGTARQFIRLVQDSPIGSAVRMDVLRAGKPLALQALIETRKPPAVAGQFAFRFPEVLRLTGAGETPQGMPWFELDPWAGAEAIPLTPQMAAFLEMPGQSGILVVSVDPQQAFAAAGIQAGDVIVSVDDQRVENPQSLMTYIKSNAGKAQMAVRFLRKGTQRIARIKLPFLPHREEY